MDIFSKYVDLQPIENGVQFSNALRQNTALPTDGDKRRKEIGEHLSFELC